MEQTQELLLFSILNHKRESFPCPLGLKPGVKLRCLVTYQSRGRLSQHPSVPTCHRLFLASGIGQGFLPPAFGPCIIQPFWLCQSLGPGTLSWPAVTLLISLSLFLTWPSSVWPCPLRTFPDASASVLVMLSLVPTIHLLHLGAVNSPFLFIYFLIQYVVVKWILHFLI